MKIELTITREDGRYLKYGEATAAGVPDSEIVLQTLLQHVQATATKVRTDLARGVPPKWQEPEPRPEDIAFDQRLLEATPREILVVPARPHPVVDYDEARREDVRAEEGDLVGDPLMPQEQDFADPTPPLGADVAEVDFAGGDELPAMPESGETVADRAVRAPSTRTARGRAVKDSPQA